MSASSAGEGRSADGGLEDLLLDLLRTSTEVPTGQTEVPPGDARIRAAVDGVVKPFLEACGPDEVRQHPDGDLAVRFGPDRDDGLLLQTYVVSQHANLMENPLDARIVDGGDVGLEGPSAVGQGATQNKGAMASVLAAARALRGPLRRPLWVSANTEGQSSHGGSRRILDDLGVRTAAAVVAIGTDLRVSLGNRGRLDVHVTVHGRSAHSSQPWLGNNPIERVGAIVEALRELPVPEPHPDLGPASVTPYQVRCEPVAPHTIPERVTLVVDRRLLPGERSDAALDGLTAHLRTAVGPDVEVGLGMSMQPVEVDAGEPIVRALLAELEAAGRPAATFVSGNAFDAGYANSLGIPTPMFGPGKRRFSGEGLVGTDAISLSDCRAAASVYAGVARRLCAR